MPRHHVMSRLAQHFEVVWLEPSKGWRDYWLPLSSKAAPIQRISSDIPGFDYFDPGRWLPEVYRPKALGDWLRFRRIAAARKILERKGCTEIVLYIWRPEFDWAVDAVSFDSVCYHIDDEYQFSPVDMPENPAEIDLIKRSDLVIIHSPKLLEMKGHLNPHTIFVPNGVDFQLYSKVAAEPDDLAAIPHPRAGYIGVIKTQLDFELMLELVSKRPDWSFIFVGPQGNVEPKKELVARLKKAPNAYFLGNRQLNQLPAYMQHMDACMMCYEVNDYTNCIYPLKVHEYLAAGRPVISTPIRAVESFEAVVQIAQTAAEWDAALLDSLRQSANSAGANERRRAVAAEHDWNILVNRIADSIRNRLTQLSA